MKSILYFASVLLLFFLTACEPGAAGSDADTTDADAKVVKVEFINPTDQLLEARIYDHEGWVVKAEVPPNSSVIEEVEQGVFSIGIKNPATDEYLHHFPSPELTPETRPNDIDYKIKIDEEGDERVRYFFRPFIYKSLYDGRFCFDMSMDSTHLYTIADARWLYSDDEDSDMEKNLAKMEAGGNKFIVGVFNGADPFPAPQKAAQVNNPLPETIDVYLGVKQAVHKVYAVPDSVEVSGIRKYIFNDILIESLLEMLTK